MDDVMLKAFASLITESGPLGLLMVGGYWAHKKIVACKDEKHAETLTLMGRLEKAFGENSEASQSLAHAVNTNNTLLQSVMSLINQRKRA